MPLSVLNKSSRSKLIDGYFRENNPYITPSGLTNVCLGYYDDIMDWKFKKGDTKYDLDEFYKYPHQQEIKGPTFKLNNMSVSLEVYPNGFTDTTEGYIHFYFIIDRSSFPKDIEDMTLYAVFYLDEIKYENRYAEVFTPFGYLSTMWYGYSIKSKYLENLNLNELNFGCYLEILHINYKKEEENDDGDADDIDNNNQLNILNAVSIMNDNDNDLSSDSILSPLSNIWSVNTDDNDKDDDHLFFDDDGDDVNGDDNDDDDNHDLDDDKLNHIRPFIRSVGTNYFTQNISMNVFSDFSWNLTNDEIHRFKECQMDFSLYSPNFNSDCLCIVTAPNGLTVIPNSAGCIFTKVKLLKLPYGIQSIELKYKLKMLSNKKTIYKTAGNEVFSYKSAGKNRKKDKWSRSSFKNSENIFITINMEIIKIYDYQNNIIPKFKWLNYGIKFNKNNNKKWKKFSSKNNNFNEEIVEQLVKLNYGTRNQCIIASRKTVDFNNINDVMNNIEYEYKSKSNFTFL